MNSSQTLALDLTVLSYFPICSGQLFNAITFNTYYTKDGGTS